MESTYRVTGHGPWGDYGRILAHGITMHLGPTSDGRLRLERTGPFMPAVTAPGFSLLVNATMRQRIEISGLTGVSFREVEKAHIVRLAWDQWDKSAAEPEEYPEGGEPEGYILQHPHDERLANEMGSIFEILALGKCTIDVQRIEHPPGPDAAPRRNPLTGEMMPPRGKTERRQKLEATDGSDSLKAGRGVFVSDRARALLDSEWLRFEALELK